MCGIVGLYLKDPRLHDRLGELFSPMLAEMTERGPDSAGVGIYRDIRLGNKVTLYRPEPNFDWESVRSLAEQDLDSVISLQPAATHAILHSPDSAVDIRAWVEQNQPNIRIMSSGSALEVYKEVGLPQRVLDLFNVQNMKGSHAIGHTRMATESAVTTEGAHPFNTGDDLCLVHNGSLSNHHLWRAWLQHNAGITFQTENDSEVAAAYLTWRLREGATLSQALEAALSDLDGFYTFAVGTLDGFSVLRDPISCKHAIMAETDAWVAMGTEYRALAGLPGVDEATVWEPKPATVYSWGRA